MMNFGCTDRHNSVYFLVFALVALMMSILGVSSASPKAVNLTSPSSGSSVWGTVPIVAFVNPGVVWVNFYIDGTYLSSSPPYLINWNSETVSNGSHTISVNAFGGNN